MTRFSPDYKKKKKGKYQQHTAGSSSDMKHSTLHITGYSASHPASILNVPHVSLLLSQKHSAMTNLSKNTN